MKTRAHRFHLRRCLAGLLALALALPSPAFALRPTLEGSTQTGLESSLGTQSGLEDISRVEVDKLPSLVGQARGLPLLENDPRKTYTFTVGRLSQSVPVRIIGGIGVGGQGIMYLAARTDTGEPVAIKVVLFNDPKTRTDRTARFDREAEGLQRLNGTDASPTLYASGYGAGRAFGVLAMECLPMDLLSYAQDRQLDGRGRIALIARMLEALGRAHAKNLVNRDVKPDNTLMTAADDVRITDWGNVHAADWGRLTREQRTNMLVTPPYVSPDRLIYGRDIGAAEDCWGVAVTALVLLTGHPYVELEQNEPVPMFQTVHRHPDPSTLEQLLRSAIEQAARGAKATTQDLLQPGAFGTSGTGAGQMARWLAEMLNVEYDRRIQTTSRAVTRLEELGLIPPTTGLAGVTAATSSMLPAPAPAASDLAIRRVPIGAGNWWDDVGAAPTGYVDPFAPPGSSAVSPDAGATAGLGAAPVAPLLTQLGVSPPTAAPGAAAGSASLSSADRIRLDLLRRTEDHIAQSSARQAAIKALVANRQGIPAGELPTVLGILETVALTDGNAYTRAEALEAVQTLGGWDRAFPIILTLLRQADSAHSHIRYSNTRQAAIKALVANRQGIPAGELPTVLGILEDVALNDGNTYTRQDAVAAYEALSRQSGLEEQEAAVVAAWEAARPDLLARASVNTAGLVLIFTEPATFDLAIPAALTGLEVAIDSDSPAAVALGVLLRRFPELDGHYAVGRENVARFLGARSAASRVVITNRAHALALVGLEEFCPPAAAFALDATKSYLDLTA